MPHRSDPSRTRPSSTSPAREGHPPTALPRLTRAQREAMQANIRRLRELQDQEHARLAAARGLPPDSV